MYERKLAYKTHPLKWQDGSKESDHRGGGTADVCYKYLQVAVDVGRGCGVRNVLSA